MSNSQTLIYLWEAEDQYKDLLDGTYPAIQIGGATFFAGEIVQKCDPIAFEIGLGEFIDHLAENQGIFVEGHTDNKDYGYNPDKENEEE